MEDNPENEENINRLNSIDIKIKDKKIDDYIREEPFYNNLDYDEDEISKFKNNRISLHVKGKNRLITILIIIIVFLLIIIGIILFFFLYEKKDSKICPKLCHCNKKVICDYCLNESNIFLEEDKICLLSNYSFVAQYHADKYYTTIKLINESYTFNINEIVIKGENIYARRIKKNQYLPIEYTFDKSLNITVYFNLEISPNSTEFMFKDIDLMTYIYFSNFNATNVNSTISMFENCKTLTSINFNEFDASNVTNMESMFLN